MSDLQPQDYVTAREFSFHVTDLKNDIREGRQETRELLQSVVEQMKIQNGRVRKLEDRNLEFETEIKFKKDAHARWLGVGALVMTVGDFLYRTLFRVP